MRLVGYDWAYRVSPLTSAIADLKMAIDIMRHIKASPKTTLVYKPGIDMSKRLPIAVHDSAFDNLPNHKLQRGHFLPLGNKEMLENHISLHSVHLLGWSCDRIPGAVSPHHLLKPMDAPMQSILSHGLAQCTLRSSMQTSEPSSMLNTVLEFTEHWPLIARVWDIGTMERVLLSDKRLSLEVTILRRELQQNIAAKWVTSPRFQLLKCVGLGDIGTMEFLVSSQFQSLQPMETHGN